MKKGKTLLCVLQNDKIDNIFEVHEGTWWQIQTFELNTKHDEKWMENGKKKTRSREKAPHLKNNHNSLWKYNSFVYFTLWIIALK